MTASGFFISFDDYRTMSVPLRAKLQEWIEDKKSNSLKPPSSLEESDNDDSPSDLSLAQAKKFLQGCSDKTKAVLRAVFARSECEFMLEELLGEMQTTSLAGVWAGVTKRTRTVLGDKDAGIFSWEWDDERADWVGSTSSMTFQSMRKALGIE